MEPVAPGTEDDPQIAYSTLTKQESEQERLLSIKALLPNGQYGNVFELNYVNGTAHWFCNACKCPVMGRVYQHEIGRRHTLNITLNAKYTSKPQTSGPGLGVEHPINVAPGEPVPPGFENDVAKEAQIQERLDGFKVGPLVALEYLLELQDYDTQKEPFYLCILCDKRGDPRTVLTHLASYNHISQYLQKHFPTCYRALAPYMTKQYKRNWQTTLQKLAEAIEKRFGRMKPIPVQNHRFEMDRMHYLEMVVKGRHFSEQMGPTFEDLIVHEELTKVYDDEKSDFKDFKPLSLTTTTQSQKKVQKRSPSPPVVARPKKNKSGPSKKPIVERRRSLSSISSVSSSDLSDYETENRRRKYRSRSPNRYQRSPSPRRRNDEYNKKERAIKIEEFKRLSKALENDMQNVLKNHEKNPEKHPKYNDEWKKFWNKRYKELQSEGVDVSKYDFKPDWIKFWNKRMTELHQEEVKIKKDALRRRLGLPDEPAPISFRIVPASKLKADPTKPSSSAPKPIPMAAQPDQDNEVIVIEDKDDDLKSLKQRSHSPWESDTSPPLKRRSRSGERRSYSRSLSKERSSSSRYRSSPSPRRHNRRSTRSRSRDRYIERTSSREYRESSYERDLRAKERVRVVSDLPWKREKHYRPDYDEYYQPPHMIRSITRKPVHPTGPIIPPEDDENIEVNVVSVLRLLTALEERLGSLGPKVIDLLAQALAMEKNDANSSENLLDSEINCVLFETVKEKLKGQLLAGIVDVIQERAFKIAIKKTASLLHMASERKKEKGQPKIDPVKVPGIGTVDKVAIAKQIANALVQQGKTDVTQSELEQLINAVIGMAEASKNSNKPMTTAAFLEKFGLNDTKTTNEESSSTKTSEEIKETTNSEPLTPTPPEKPSTINSSMDHLSESDLQTLLQNFKDLSTDEQHGLINYLKKLEAHEPERVERLRKFVNLGTANVTTVKNDEQIKSGRESPFSHRHGGQNPEADENIQEIEDKSETKIETKINLDSDEEDYTFDDVVQAVKEKQRTTDSENFDMKKSEVDLSDAKALISNLMSNINKTTVSSPINLLGLGGNSTITTTTAAELTKTLNTLPINMDNLANIVGNVQKLTQQEKQPIITFEPPQQPLQFGNNNPRFETANRSNNLQGIVGPERVNINADQRNLHGIVGPERNTGNFSRPMVQYPQKSLQYNMPFQQQQQQQGFQQPFQRQPNTSGNFNINQYSRQGGNNNNNNNYNRW